MIFLDVADKEALWRISGRHDNREDETVVAIRRRIDLFHEWTLPVLGYYESQNKLVRIDGEQEVVKVFDDICKSLNKLEKAEAKERAKQ